MNHFYKPSTWSLSTVKRNTHTYSIVDSQLLVLYVEKSSMWPLTSTHRAHNTRTQNFLTFFTIFTWPESLCMLVCTLWAPISLRHGQFKLCVTKQQLSHTFIMIMYQHKVNAGSMDCVQWINHYRSHHICHIRTWTKSYT